MSGDGQNSDDERLAVNLRLLREGKMMSQAALAEKMTARGHPWHQSTVHRMESGKQAAGHSEAISLAKILGIPLERLTASSPESDAMEKVLRAGADMETSADYVSESVHALLAARANAETVIAGTQDAGWPKVRTLRDRLAGQAGKRTLEAAIAEGVRRHEEHDDPEASR